MAEQGTNGGNNNSGVNQSISIGGNVGGDVTQSGGDLVQGNQTNITTGNITNRDGGNVVIGSDNIVTSNVKAGGQASLLAEAYSQLYMMDLPAFKEKSAEKALDDLKDLEGESTVDQDEVDFYLHQLETTAPKVLEIVLNAVVNPVGAATSALGLAIKTYRNSRKG